MTNGYDENEARLDKLLLIFRRLFFILFILFVLRILLFKIFKINKNEAKDVNGEVVNENIETEVENVETEAKDVELEDKDGKKDLGKSYSIDGNNVLYEGEIIKFADAKSFKVINKKDLEGKDAINSDNLLEIFADYDTRVILMKNIDNIIKNKENVTLELKNSSENGMYKMRKEYDQLAQFDRGDRYEMTNEQRAKFAIMFLYIKIIKKYSNNQATMGKALEELKIFLENFDKKDLVKERSLRKARGDLGVDNDCLYVDGELYACFLDDLFVK